MEQSVREMCLEHFNEPVLVTGILARLIGYGEDAHDCYLIVRFLGDFSGLGQIKWYSAVGGCIFLTALKGQNLIISDSGEQWDDFSDWTGS